MTLGNSNLFCCSSWLTHFCLRDRVETGPGASYPAALGSKLALTPGLLHPQRKKTGSVTISEPLKKSGPEVEARNPNQFRLERFGKAMSGTGSWEAPGAVLSGTCEVWSTLRIYTEYMRFY